MAFKHQSKSYRDGGKWVCWCDGLTDAPQIAANIRKLGFRARREGLRVFVLACQLAGLEAAMDT